jgi:methionyl-tRNA formyltransferase
MLYLFCNEQFGLPFLEKARQYSQLHSLPIRIFFSGKGLFATTQDSALIQKIHFWILKKKLEYRIHREYRMRIQIVSEVNSIAFQKRITQNTRGIIAGFNQIFNKATIERFDSLVNFHPSILPFYRGPVPSYWCIARGESKTGYTLHRVTPTIDQGEILYQEEVTIPDGCTEEQLDHSIATKASELMWKYLDHISYGTAWDVRQLDANQTYQSPVRYLSFPDRR